MKKLNIRMKILLPTIVLVLTGFAVLTTVIMLSFYSTSVALETDYVEEVAKHQAYAVKSVLDVPLDEARAISNTLSEIVVENSDIIDRDKVIELLENWVKEDSTYYSAFTIWEENAFDGMDSAYAGKPNHDKTGRFIPYIYRGNGGITKSAYIDYNIAEFYQVVKSTKKETITDAYITSNGDAEALVITLVQPIMLDGEFLGVIGVDLLTDNLQSIVDKSKYFSTGYMWITSYSANLIAHPKMEIVNTDVTGYFDPSYEAPIKNSIADENLTFEVQNKSYVNGIVSQVTFVSVEIGNTGKNYAAAVSIPFAELNAATNKGITTGIIMAIAFLVAITGLLFFITSRFISKPIIGSINQIQNSAGQVSYSSKQLSESSQQLSEGATEQAAAIEETSATMDETSSMVKQNAENTRQANNLSKEASKAAEVGSSRMQEMTSSMEELKKSSGDISKIIKVIDEIAFQTNMLALNAAVEAARAGDAGQGFAVVAEEVRNLAQKSAKAAKDTAEIIDRNIELSERGVAISTDVNDSLEEIMQKTNDVNQLIEEISAASDEQAKGTSQVTEAIGQMEIVVQSNAASSEESAASAEELRTQASMLERIVLELNEMVKGEGKASKESSNSNSQQGGMTSSNSSKNRRSLDAGNASRKHIMAADDVIPLDDDEF